MPDPGLTTSELPDGDPRAARTNVMNSKMMNKEKHNAMKQLPTCLLLLLVVLTACTGRYDAMRAALDSINVLNRTDKPFTTDDVQPYVDYFDRHGNSNDRLLAHYLLGRAYHEHGEAPMALQCYQQAADCADTTAADCDYAQLCRVYGQMGEIFYDQSLFRHYLTHFQLAERFAWLGKDTLSAITYYDLQNFAYSKLGLPDSVMIVVERAVQLYMHYGKPQYAATALGSLVFLAVEKGNLKKARKYISLYESSSGFFNPNGNIETGREIFYYAKGLLYIKENRLDSAEYLFRKELRDGKDYNNQNGGALGLAMLYEQLQIPDSAAKYYQYAYAMNDSMYAQKATETIERMQSMYDYSRHQELARKAEKQAARERSIWQWGGCIAAIIILIVLHVLYRIRAERQKALQQYEQSIEKLKLIEGEIVSARKDILILSTHKNAAQEIIEEKENRIRFLEAESQRQQQESQQKLDEKRLSLAEESLKKQVEYMELVSEMNRGTSITDSQKEKLETILRIHFPKTFELITTKRHSLSEDEYLTCMLIRLHIPPTQIGLLIEKTGGSITNIRVRLLKKLFGKQGKAIEFDKSICSIC